MSSPRSHRASRVAVALAMAAVACALAPPASAADIDYKGWFVALDAALTQPGGLDQHYATVMDVVTLDQEIRYMENDPAFSGQAAIGYSWGTLGGLSVSYWSFDNDDSVAETLDAYVFPGVFSGYAGYAGVNFGLGLAGPVFNGYPVSFTAGSEVKATSLDLEYSRPMEAGENFTVTWLAGLRSVTFEEDLAFDGIDSYPDYPVHYIQTRHIESDGIGLKVGAIFDFGITRHFSLQGRLSFSFLQGQIDAVTTQEATNYFGAPSPVYQTVFDEIKTSQENVSGEIRDYDLRAVWSWKTVDFYVGYGGSTWEGLVANPLGDAAILATQPGSDRDSVSFNSAHAGVVLRLGGG